MIGQFGEWDVNGLGPMACLPLVIFTNVDQDCSVGEGFNSPFDVQNTDLCH
jgi:hypothetical protein